MSTEKSTIYAIDADTSPDCHRRASQFADTRIMPFISMGRTRRELMNLNYAMTDEPGASFAADTHEDVHQQFSKDVDYLARSGCDFVVALSSERDVDIIELLTDIGATVVLLAEKSE